MNSNTNGRLRTETVAGSAAAIVASSDSLAAVQPLFASLAEVASKLTAGFSEVEEVRRKLNEVERRCIQASVADQITALLISRCPRATSRDRRQL